MFISKTNLCLRNPDSCIRKQLKGSPLASHIKRELLNAHQRTEAHLHLYILSPYSYVTGNLHNKRQFWFINWYFVFQINVNTITRNQNNFKNRE